MAGTAGEAGNSPPPAQGLLRAKVLHGGAYLFLRQFLSLGSASQASLSSRG